MPRYIPDFREAFDHFCLHAGGWVAGQAGRWAAVGGLTFLRGPAEALPAALLTSAVR
jgi:hypothetical protein